MTWLRLSMDMGGVEATSKATEVTAAKAGSLVATATAGWLRRCPATATGGRAAQGEEEAGLPEPATGVYLAEKEVSLLHSCLQV